MSLSLYDVSIPVTIRYLENLASVLKKGRAFADDADLPHDRLLQARLANDMMSLTEQVQRASDTAKYLAVRVGQAENKPMADDERSFDDLFARIAATIDFLKAVPREAFEGRAEAEVPHPAVKGRRFTGLSYVTEFALPNFFFHVTTAYDLLRQKGVPIGKQDYLGLR